MQDLQPPSNKSELNSFLRICNVYGLVVPHSVCLSALLNKMLKKGDPRTFDTLTQKEHDAIATYRIRRYQQ